MRTRAPISRQRTRAWRIRDMASMISTIKILTVPARGENDGGTDAARAGFGGKRSRVMGVTRRTVAAHYALAGREAAVADTRVGAGFAAEHGVAREHTETLQHINLK